MKSPIAIVGMACRYPDADTVDELFENSLAQRRAFREIPEGRLASAGYFDAAGKDQSYSHKAAVLKNFEFDHERFCVSRSSFEVTDMTHWLALTVAAEALDDIPFLNGRAPPRERARVVVGNTLTGEFSRAQLMRLRWPYVSGVVAHQLESMNLDPAQRERFLRELEASYKAPFASPNEDFLAGGLSNTIAGRICNHFDFNGGGYTIDGACASSLLAVTDACSALASGEADMALAGGVDLSLDPFELVGFSRTAALARNEMLVYDEDSEGFWPGEGCGFVALMRYQDAVEQCARIHAVIAGWGISSDGKGGLTRPEKDGQMLALQRAYDRAGYGIRSVSYFEGHGTGTKVGDAAELGALIAARQNAGTSMTPAVISSIKANIGHTKAAAGLAGLLRATKCVAEKVLPPTTACQRPHPLFAANGDNLRVSDHPEAWEIKSERRAGISAMGFGGINTHLTIEEAPAPRRSAPRSTGKFDAFQDAELFLFCAADDDELQTTIAHVASFVDQCSRAELTDLALELARRADASAPFKAAVVANTPAELGSKLKDLADGKGGVVSAGTTLGEIGLLFPGQGSPARADAGLHGRRFEDVRRTYNRADLASFAGREDTDFAQPAIITASLAGLDLLHRIGVEAEVALGHSLGELAALHWAGFYGRDELLAIARARGQAMVNSAGEAGAMVAVGADREQTLAAIGGSESVFIANINSPKQTVVSGPREEIEALTSRLKRQGLTAIPIKVRHAFHTPAMRGASIELRAMLEDIRQREAGRNIVSTVTGNFLPATVDVPAHLCEQLVSPVHFLDAVRLAAEEVDVFLEVGPGDVIGNLARSCCDTPVISIDVGGDSLRGFLEAAGAAFALGRAPEISRLFEDRFARPFEWNWNPQFLTNPCEANPNRSTPVEITPEPVQEQAAPAAAYDGTTIDRLRQIIADRTGLPAASLKGDRRMLSDLHLNSITVGEIVAQAASSGGLGTPVDPTEFADASIREIAAALDQLAESPTKRERVPAGLESWVRYFEMTRADAPAPEPNAERASGNWQVFGGGGDLLQERLNDGRYGSGVLFEMPGSPEFSGLLESAQTAGRQAAGDLFVIVQCGLGASGFARSFFLENEQIPTLVINIPTDDDDGTEAILREIEAAGAGFNEVYLDSSGKRQEAQMRPVPNPGHGASSLVNDDDVILVSGGGKGISAECGFQLARETGCALLILGRSAPDDSPELANNLARLRAAAIRLSYQVADVTDPAAVSAAVGRGVDELGSPVTGIVHGAGSNHPRLISTMSSSDIEATLRPKLDGLDNLLAASDTDRLKLLVTFSSIIGRIGLKGEADYALANEWLSQRTHAFQTQHPHCRCRAIEWSVWSGAGMGQRLGRIDALVNQGISPISIDDGVREFLRLVDTPDLPTSLVVSGRFGNPPTVKFDRPPLERFRFIDSTPVFYPGTELVAECLVSPATDPYLDDHVLNGERLFPAVMALEAMAEAVATLTGRETEASPVFHDVQFRKALVAVSGEPVTLRVTAVSDESGAVSLAIRCSTTDFQVNHVEAKCTPGESADHPFEAPAPGEGQLLDPANALYQNVLFQDGRFRRIQGYRMIEARRCSGQLSSDGATQWFSAELPQTCLLGDPGARDAALHAIQACIPHKTVIPIAVEQIEAGVLDVFQPHRMLAEEIEDRGKELVYDLTIFGPDNRQVERWKRITLRAMGTPATFHLNAPSLAAPFLERRVAEVMPEAALKVAFAKGERTTTPDPQHRPDGKPDPSATARFQSAAYSDEWRLSVDSVMPVGCDLQTVPSHKEPGGWESLLGADGIKLAGAVSSQAGEPLDVSATRVWTVREAMKKAGLAPDAPLALDRDSSSEWVRLSSGATSVFSSLIDAPAPMCVAAALRPEEGPHAAPAAPKAFEHRHIVSFEETNVVGNVYYVNQIAWQGRCREMFLKQHCPEVIDELRTGLTLATTRCSCEYFHELHAFDEIVIRMQLGAMTDNRVEMKFEYFKLTEGGGEQFAAKGVQEIACMRTVDGVSHPTPIPDPLRRALEEYRGA